ncbi:MAG TPA: hypothetical protein VE621_14490, partial [Bryobacteraceae bacterium]|nr:hypothetical protein [Bryobacteraceae bacterium]
AITAAPGTPSGDTTDQGKVRLRKAVEEERKRSLKPARSAQPTTEAARTLQKKMGASAAYANRAVEEIASKILGQTPGTDRKQ